MRNGARLASDGDLAWAALLAGATALYLATLPHDLYPGDEGRFLYEAKRLIDGDVPYRDFFDFITPGLLYLLALAYRNLRHEHRHGQGHDGGGARPDGRRHLPPLPDRPRPARPARTPARPGVVCEAARQPASDTDSSRTVPEKSRVSVPL